MKRTLMAFAAGLFLTSGSMTGPLLAALPEAGGESMASMSAPSSPPASGPSSSGGNIPGRGFAVEGFAGGDTSLSGAYGTTLGQTVPYAFGPAPFWGFRIGKMAFSRLFLYLAFQQSDFSQNTHTLIGFGGNYYLPGAERLPVLPYLNATFGASYNTYGGVDAQAGYGWMLGAGALYPVSENIGVFLEADASYETAPLGINTSIGNPPGTIAHVSDAWSMPVMVGIRYAF